MASTHLLSATTIATFAARQMVNSDHWRLVCSGSYVRGSRIEKVCWVHGKYERLKRVISARVSYLLMWRVGEVCMRRVIIDKDADIAPGTQIGVNWQKIKQKLYRVSDTMVVVISKGARVGCTKTLTTDAQRLKLKA